MGREREREKVEGEGMALVLSKTVIFGSDHHPKSTRDILRYRYWSYLHKVISRRLQILKSLYHIMILLKRGSTIRDLTFRLRQNLGAKTFVLVRVDLTLKTTPPPVFLDPIH